MTARVAKEFFPAPEEARCGLSGMDPAGISPGPGELERQRNTVLSCHAEVQSDPSGKRYGRTAAKAASPESGKPDLPGILKSAWRMKRRTCAFMKRRHTFEKEEKRLHVTEQPEHTGIAEGVQAELSLAKGEYLIFFWREGTLQHLDALSVLAQAVGRHPAGAYCLYPDNDRMTPRTATTFLSRN